MDERSGIRKEKDLERFIEVILVAYFKIIDYLLLKENYNL